MGNTTTTQSVYVVERKGSDNKKKTYWTCPDHMPIIMRSTGTMAVPPDGTKIYRFELPEDVPVDTSPTTLPYRTIKRYKKAAVKVENVTGQLTERDVEILAHMAPTTNSSSDDDGSSSSSLTRIAFDPVHDFLTTR